MRGIALKSADNQAADPKSWILKGSNDGDKWTVLDQRTNETFNWRLYTRPFEIEHPGKYSYYKLEITDNGGDSSTTLAEVELLGHQYEKAPVKNIADLDELVNRFEDEGAFANHGAAQALHVHLATVKHFAEKEEAEKVIKHLKGFNVLLDHQKKNELISEEAYHALKADTDYLIKTWENK